MRWILPGLILILSIVVTGCDSAAPPPTPTITVVIKKAIPPPTETPVPPQPTDTVAPAPTVVPTAAPVPSATPAPLYVGKTDGDGIWLRASPPSGDKLQAWPDGTKMVTVGPDKSVDGKVWKNVKDPKGTVGWVSADYLLSAPEAAPAGDAATPTNAASG
jgi:hypothetical protein